MALANITFINQIDMLRDDYIIKVRVVRLWKQPMFKNPTETYSIEMILMDEQPTGSGSLTITSSAIDSEETINMKDSTSFTGENVTPASYSEKTTRNNPVINKKTLMASSSNNELKRKLEDIYDVEDKLPTSASKGLFSMEDDVANCNDTLLIPKLEK
ncbi:hypothetical protein E3N88_40434 [Mikania micrantha]|uniref:DUF223 domain-containing protein n=1 Tax=Mikania micrantha TaxID=192012 RepID=A0A5N6LMQ0_9ASTR|nr:hypothetical protein E3N88_40434 [Mikania micrantha]